jgi:molybdopterin-binding protein
LVGTIDEIVWGDVLVHVTVRVGDHVVESVITRRSAEEMALKRGTPSRPSSKPPRSCWRRGK